MNSNGLRGVKPSGDRGTAPQGANHDREAADQARRQIHELAALDELCNARQDRALTGTSQNRGHFHAAEKRGWQVQQRKETPARIASHPAVRPLRKHQREVDEERRQQQS